MNHQQKKASSLVTGMLLAKKRVSKRENTFFTGECCFFHWRIGLLAKKEDHCMPKDFATCDLCDAHKADFTGDFRVLPPSFKDFGQVTKFSGPVRTVKCFEDNTLVKAAVDSPGFVDGPQGRVAAVLVVDGGGSLRRALLGGNLGAAAARNGWAGVVIDGCVRDTAELAHHAVGIRAIAAMPMPTEKRNEGQTGVAVQVQGVWVRPGDWLYADEDGIVVGATALV
jgi:regulator of ribonuclease activity A